MTEPAAMRPLGAFLRLTVASLQTAAGRLRDRASGSPVPRSSDGRVESGAGFQARAAFARFRDSHASRASRKPFAPTRDFLGGLATAVSLLCLFTSPYSWAQATPPGTAISNTAQASYVRGSATPATTDSNAVVVVVEPQRSTATLKLVRPVSPSNPLAAAEAFGPTQCVGTNGVQALPPPVAIDGTVLNPALPLTLFDTASYHGGEAVFARIEDPDQNRDATLRETIDVRLSSQSGDMEVLRFTETAVSSGVFVGYVQTAASAATSGDCALQVSRDSLLFSSYVDQRDATDAVQAQALVDPTGLVFDSRTAQPVNGARIRLVDAVTGLPAQVRGDDGVSLFPSEIVTGAQATDSGGTVYAFAPGAFRFPVVNAPQGYRFEIVAPAGYRFPSTATAAEIDALPGSPYRVNPGSYGNAFTVAAPPDANLDVPLDRLAGELFLDKSTVSTIVSLGDFVQYSLRLEHAGSGVPLNTVTIADILPRGMRLRSGSVRMNDQPAGDPQIASDGRTLTFDIGTLDAGEAVTLRYVAEVTIAARGTRLVNDATAFAAGGAIASNKATASVTLREDLNRDQAFIVGRVAEGGCGANLKGPGVAGVRVYLEDGRYSVTDTDGQYHFEDVPAGAHVVQLDTETIPDTLEAVTCDAPSRHAGRAWSRFVDVRGGAMARASFTLDARKPPEGKVDVEMRRESGDAQSAAVELKLIVDTVAVGNARALVMLPGGYEYVPESATVANRGGRREAGETAPQEPEIASGIASFRLGELPAGSETHVSFVLRKPALPADAATLVPASHLEPTSEAIPVLRATVLFDSPTQNGQRVKPLELPIETGAAVTSVSAPTLGVIAMLRAPGTAPVAAIAPVTREDEENAAILPNIESIAPGIDWVLPEPGFRPAITSLKVALRHLPGQTVALRLNGEPVDMLNFYGTATNKARTVAVSLWRGVDIPEGKSDLTAIVQDEGGMEVQRLTRSIDYASGPARAELLADQSQLIADGRMRPVIRLKVTDERGEAARRGTMGVFRVDPPHRSWFEVQSLHENKLVATGHREPVYTVAENGIADIELEPTTRSGEVVLRLKYAQGREQEMRAWLKPAARDWVLVGVAEGTAAYNTLSQNMEAAESFGAEEGLEGDGRVAFFAKGRIKGDFLLTIAYDSARDPEGSRARLQDAVDPQRYYTLYGDGTEQRNEAASREKLYIKLEREQFYALFGDFETGLTITELSRYSRSLNGLRTEYAGDLWSVSAFAAHTDQNAVRDELRGDGTSGLYRLSRQSVLPGSDKIRIEVRDRFRIEQVLETRPLARFLDYSIDYARGTVFFKEPVPSRNENFDFVYIIAEYETTTASTEDTTAGGRAAVKFGGVEIGASVLHEGAQAGDRSLAGADVRWRAGQSTEVRAEFARSDDHAIADGSAQAYLAEVTHVSERVNARAYVREQEEGFGLGQQLATEAGTRKIGGEGRVYLTEQLSVQAETYRQEYLATDAQRELASLELRYQDESYGAGVGLRHVSDDVRGETLESEEAYAQASMDLFDGRLRLRASGDMAVSDTSNSIDFPARSLFGIDWRLTPDVALFTEYEHAEGDNIESDMTRVGVKATPWNRARIQSSLNQEQTENGPRTFSNIGLVQGFQLNERWSLDLGLDQSNTLRGPETQPLSPNVPLASGTLNDDFLAAYAGALYRSQYWTFTSRVEHRSSDLEDRFSVTGGFYREPIKGHAFSLSLLALDSESIDDSGSTQIDARLGWAYRPVESNWIVLDRLDLIHEKVDQAGFEQTTARIVNTLNANWQVDPRTELGLQFGGRYARANFDGEAYSGYSDVYGADLRRDIDSRYDFGVHTTVLNSWSSDLHEYSLGFDVGFTLARNVWIAVGYNFQGFHDEDFSANRYTEQGPFIKLRIKADQDTLKDFGL